MFSLKLVLVAILIFLGCALAQSLQGEATASEVAGLQEDGNKLEKRWRWHNNNKGHHGRPRPGNNNNNDDDSDDDDDDDESDDDNNNNNGNGNNNNNNDDGFPNLPCHNPNGGSPSTVRPTSAPATQAPATQRPTTAPTTRPSAAPTTRPSAAPTTRATEKPTQRPTSAPATQRPTSAPATQRPATQKPTSPATQRPTQKPTSPATQRPTSAPATQRPTSPATQRPTSAPVTQRPTSAPVTSSPGSNYGTCDLVPTSAEPLKMLLPLYTYPGSSWDQVVSAASKIDIVAIINPSSGPGKSADSSYVSYMNKLNNAKVEQVGYVYTSYGDRSISAVKADIDIYATKYSHINGIFFDEASNSASDIPYYRELYNYVMAKGFKHSILNPGASTDQGYVSISTNIVVFETAGSGSSGSSSFVKCAPSASQKAGYKYKFSGIAHSTSSSSVASVIQKFHNSGMGMVYVTERSDICCIYNTIASYFSSEVTTIQSLNGK